VANEVVRAGFVPKYPVDAKRVMPFLCYPKKEKGENKKPDKVPKEPSFHPIAILS
jgi:hypothetical protein